MDISDWVGWVIAIATFLVGIPLAFWIGKRNRQLPDLRRATGFQRLGKLDRTFGPGVSASFGGVPLSQVSRSYLALWNHRGDHVDGGAILKDDPLRIEVDEDDAVLQTRLLAQSRPQIGLRTEKVGAQTHVKFTFLDAGDGGVLEVLHTGRTPARVVGTIPGAKLGSVARAGLGPGARKAVRSTRWQRTKILIKQQRRRIFGWAMVTAGALGLVIGALTSLIDFLREPKLVDPSRYALDTLEGQLEFAKAIRENGTFDWGLVVTLVAVLIFGLTIDIIYVRRFIKMTTAIIPRSIVAEDVDANDRSPNAALTSHILTPVATETGDTASRHEP